jgi:Delta7-sterol 5-desaturase
VETLAGFVAHLLTTMPYPQAALFFLGQNLLVFVGALVFGQALVRLFSQRRVTPAPPQVERLEIGLATSTVVLNAAVTFAGLWLYRRGSIAIASDVDPWRVGYDVALLVLVMDAVMYGLHRVAHHRWLMPLLHAPHHRYAHPRPLTLFVLHPFETLAFGGLWLVVLSLYEASWLSIAIYLTINLLFGVIGHVGVEPTPSWPRSPGLRWVATASFHAGHHVDPEHNFGFYTRVWDHLFGTLEEETK